LIVPVIIEESIEFIHFIKDVMETVLETRKVCEYIIDLVFGMQTFDEFYNFSRSTILQLFKPIELIVSKLLLEIREDNFSMKFQLNHLKETTAKIEKGCRDMSRELQDLQNKNIIDIRYSCQNIDTGFLVLVDMIENVHGRIEDHFRNQSDKLRQTISNIEKN